MKFRLFIAILLSLSSFTLVSGIAETSFESPSQETQSKEIFPSPNAGPTCMEACVKQGEEEGDCEDSCLLQAYQKKPVTPVS